MREGALYNRLEYAPITLHVSQLATGSSGFLLLHGHQRLAVGLDDKDGDGRLPNNPLGHTPEEHAVDP